MSQPKCYADDHYSAGQPTPEQLAALAREGVRTVINLRAPDEAVDYDEAAEAERLGLRYVALPVRGADDLDRERVREFGRELDAARSRGPVLIHCASGNRVGAMVALDEALNRGCDLDSALDQGRRAGLQGLEPAVVELAGREGAAS